MTLLRKEGGHDGAWILAWTLVGLGLRAILCGFANRISGDAVGWYIPMARAFFEGRWGDGFDAYIPPVYSLCVAGIAKILPAAAWHGPLGDAGAFELAGQITSTLFGTATIPLIYLLVRRLAPSSHAAAAARLAAVLAALSPFLARFSARVLSESTYTFFFIAAALLGLSLLARQSPLRAAAFGLSVGLAALNRPEAMGLLIVIGAWIGLPALRRPRALLRATGLGMIVALFFLAGVFPQIAVTHARTGVWTLSAKGGQIFESSHTKEVLAREEWLYPAPEPAGGSAAEIDDGAPARSDGPLGYILENPATFAGHYVSTLADFVIHIPGVMGAGLTMLALIGIFFRRHLPRGAMEGVAASVPITFVLILSLFHSSERFLLPFLPFGILWSSLGFLEIAERLEEGVPRPVVARLPEGVRRNPRAWILRAVVLLLLLEALVPIHEWGWSWYWSPEKRVGVWMRAHLPSGPKVMTRSSNVEAYYAGARIAYFPAAPYDEVMRYLHKAQVRYVLMDDIKTRRLRPGFIESFQKTGGKLLQEFDYGRKRVYLYEVVRPEAALLEKQGTSHLASDRSV